MDSPSYSSFICSGAMIICSIIGVIAFVGAIIFLLVIVVALDREINEMGKEIENLAETLKQYEDDLK